MNYQDYLKKDKKLAAIVTGQPYCLNYYENIPLRLIASVMSQQLNTKVATIIYNRFIALYKGTEPDARQILDTSYDQLRSIGLSNAKTSYVHNVARFCVEHSITDKQLRGLDNEAVKALLTQIKGVGCWTVEMLLMFTLGREDVFPIDDMGIQNAMIKLYQINIEDKRLRKERLQKIAAKWSPYRTYACMHLWAWKDGAEGM